jgi:steroid 5-alpha reductase family enzyme
MRTPYQPNLWIIVVPFAYFMRHNYNFLTFWPGLSYEDFRYPVFRKLMPNDFVYWTFSYFGLHVGPTLMVYFGLFPTYYSLFDSDQDYNNLVFYFGVVFGLGAIAFEAIADL